MQRTSSAPALLRKQCPVCNQRYPTHFMVCPTDASPLGEVSDGDLDSLIGATLGETYQILRVIGEGGMGRVYEARHTRLFSRRFAIKVLHGDLTRQSEVVGRFLREAEATSRLNHPNIVGMVDVDQVPDGRPYIVAELLEGHQLGDYFEHKGKLPVTEAIGICRQICHALIAAHDKDIVHRDIKPENIFLVGQGQHRIAKVLDFGISRVGDAAGSMTKTGMVMGTPAYMPPEQARGARVDHRADIYAVGALLYEALTGKPPFQGADAVSTLGAVLTETPKPPSTLVPNIPSELEAVLLKAMAKAPEERFATMREFDEALAPFDAAAQDAVARHSRTQRFSTAPPPPAAELIYPDHWAGVWLRRLTTNAPELARKQLTLLSIAAAWFLFAGLVASCGSILRLQNGESSLTGREIVLCCLIALTASTVPAFAWAQYLFWSVWPSTTRVILTLKRARRAFIAATLTYAAGLSVAHVLDALYPKSHSVLLALSNLLVFAAALVAGCAVGWLEFKARAPEGAQSASITGMH